MKPTIRIECSRADAQLRHNSPDYLIRNEAGRVSLVSASGTPLALSNIFDHAMRVKFAIEDAATGEDVMRVLDKLGPRYGSGPQAGKPFWEFKLLSPAAPSFAAAVTDFAVEALAFIQTIARMETPAEFDERTGDEGMSGDDAVDTVGDLISQARDLLERTKGSAA